MITKIDMYVSAVKIDFILKFQAYNYLMGKKIASWNNLNSKI